MICSVSLYQLDVHSSLFTNESNRQCCFHSCSCCPQAANKIVYLEVTTVFVQTAKLRTNTFLPSILLHLSFVSQDSNFKTHLTVSTTIGFLVLVFISYIKLFLFFSCVYTLFVSVFWLLFFFLVPEIIDGNTLTSTVVDLNAWVEYEFRVLAKNSVGVGEPSPVTVKTRTEDAGAVDLL